MPKKIGKDICPLHQVLGFYKPHRRPNKIEVHYTFVHNDRTIPEHYVSKAARNQKIVNEMAQSPLKEWYFNTIAIAQALNRTAYLTRKFGNKINKYQLDKEEARRLGEAVRPKVEVVNAIGKISWLEEQLVYALTNNLPVPKQVEHGLFTVNEMSKKLKQEIAILDERMRYDPVGVIAEAIEVSSSDPFRKEVTYLFNKYERPKRLDRNKARNDKFRYNYNNPPRTLPEQDQPEQRKPN